MCQRDLIWDTVDKLRDSEETVLSVPCNDYVVETTMVWIKSSQHALRLAPAHIYSAEGSNPNTHNWKFMRRSPLPTLPSGSFEYFFQDDDALFCLGTFEAVILQHGVLLNQLRLRPPPEEHNRNSRGQSSWWQ